MRPPKLIAKDKVAIVAPSGRIDTDDLDQAIELLEDWGLQVHIGTHVFAAHGFFAAREDQRLHDLQEAMNDNEVKCIFCARGGFGIGKILDRLDFSAFDASPKWIVGFSDITLLHLHFFNLGFQTIHGPVARQLGSGVDNTSVTRLREILFNDSLSDYTFFNSGNNRVGKGKGYIIGGNLTLIGNALGTPSEPEFEGCILFFEDINESIYRLDRVLNQLHRGGVLDCIKGLVVGQLTNIGDTSPGYGKDINQVIREYVEGGDYPVAFNFPAGHERSNYPLPHGALCQLEVGENKSTLTFLD